MKKILMGLMLATSLSACDSESSNPISKNVLKVTDDKNIYQMKTYMPAFGTKALVTYDFNDSTQTILSRTGMGNSNTEAVTRRSLKELQGTERQLVDSLIKIRQKHEM